MYKIRRMKFDNHPILGNLDLDFCDNNGRAVDTVIIAGENGVGKSTVLNMLYKVATHTVDIPLYIEIEDNNVSHKIEYMINGYLNDKPVIYANDGHIGLPIVGSDMKGRYPFSGIYSDVGINFNAKPIQSITSQDLDTSGVSRKSSTDLANQINQLFVDIQNIDDGIFAQVNRSLIKEHKLGIDTTTQERMPRFINAFNKMFDDLKYDCIENKNNTKMIMFTKNGARFPIEDLSSGEKQIIYRGAFLLRDANATNGAFVFIDEPEISLHPHWQQKIMNYYKNIFTNANGKQTSQIFAVTHSPFIIHNDNRYNDKVIVLKHDKNGDITVMDNPEYYKCNTIEAIQDAFLIDMFTADQPTVYVEGETDAKYFNKVLEVYERTDIPFKIRSIVQRTENKRTINGGNSGLNRAAMTFRAIEPTSKQVMLYDCDTNKQYEDKHNVVTCVMPKFNNSKGISVGIENALNLDNLDIDNFLKPIGMDQFIVEKGKKMECCDYICGQDIEILRNVFIYMNNVLDKLQEIISGKDCSEYFK